MIIDTEKVKKILGDAKYIIATIGVIVTSLIGGWQLVTSNFVTKAYAENIIRDSQSQLQVLQEISQQNTIMILELRMIKFEQKMESGQKLSSAEQREYDILKQQVQMYKLQEIEKMKK